MHDAVATVPTPVNEPILGYAPGSAERTKLKAELARQSKEVVDIPCIVGGQRVETGRVGKVVMPHDHHHVLAQYHSADPDLVKRAIRSANEARREWAAMRWEARAAVFLRAAELLATTWRQRINAATMLGQSKTAHQAEIDSACELIDFLRFNVSFAADLYRMQPISGPGMWNQQELRPLDGFVFALTPFNFTAIAGNLPTAPAILGNTCVWKPAEVQLHAAYQLYLLLEEAGLPPGVINFVPGPGAQISSAVLDDPDLAAIHFTGSTEVFRSLWQGTAERISRYRNYPRLVGETGGKDFIVAHASADPAAVATAIVRGGFEYQGQKCSAASRIYVAASVWSAMQEELRATIESLKMGDVSDFSNFMGAVIKKSAFDKHAAAIAEAKASTGMTVLAGGETDDKKGYFVRPTLIETDDPGVRLMRDELFGPIVTLHVYPDQAYSDILEVVDKTSPYALTGAVFARDRAAIVEAGSVLRHAAGNFYINDKPTGAVVGQQPFGGARASGTCDKAGSPLNLLRFAAARTIKETFVPPTDWKYPFLAEP